MNGIFRFSIHDKFNQQCIDTKSKLEINENKNKTENNMCNDE